jgi:hypothetical protein
MSKCFVVLGMHRSATSLIAKGLAESNVSMGSNLLIADKSNLFGHWEDMDFLNLNKAILRDAGGDWDDPPPEEKILELADTYEAEIKELINRKKKDLWGWKDPRTTLTIKLFAPYLENPHWITCFRQPEQVAQSLLVRNNFPIEKGLALCIEYNKRLLNFLLNNGDLTDVA